MTANQPLLLARFSERWRAVWYRTVADPVQSLQRVRRKLQLQPWRAACYGALLLYPLRAVQQRRSSTASLGIACNVHSSATAPLPSISLA